MPAETIEVVYSLSHGDIIFLVFLQVIGALATAAVIVLAWRVISMLEGG